MERNTPVEDVPARQEWRDRQLMAATSTGQRNTCIKSLSWRFKLQCFAGPFVELSRHLV
jgi:hypothetical protein